jgi:hypothetical protein
MVFRLVSIGIAGFFCELMGLNRSIDSATPSRLFYPSNFARLSGRDRSSPHPISSSPFLQFPRPRYLPVIMADPIEQIEARLGSLS